MLNPILDKNEFEKSKEIMAEIVAKFENNKDFYTSNSFKEEEAKIEFINPMFEALGWDVHNKQKLGPSFKEVIFEESLSIGKETKAPDYSFRLGGQLIYYLEAKKPSVNIKDDKSPAYQARRYGWSAKIPIVILTDFEEFAVYETTSKPQQRDKASAHRVLYYTFDEYLDKWEEIYSLFSKEAVLKELFRKFAEDNTSKTKKGTQSIDTEFLKDIEKWRLILARNIALRNKELTLEELNLAVQLIIDRIVFFRMAEDRGIERYQTLYKLSESENIYEQLCDVFKKADLKYNSGLFHFNVTPDYSEFVDNITLHLNIDDGVFKEIFRDLYYPYSPYEFSVISPEILGSIYENFLGSEIRLTPSHQAKIELKPEIKKAGGVFYTPQYIVDYIVEEVIGNLIKDKTPNQISELKILDPACGSGSFLLRAYQKLLDYHLEYYISLKKAPKEVYYIGKDNVPRLTIREKKRILTNNIFGVDIDVNAVEVTKLSLLLKVLEDENKDVLEQQQKLFQEKVLPNLSYNIKCGNSLIGTDILEQENLEHGDLLKINPFDWEEEFPQIFENGGFDAIIGNPPYIRTQLLDKISKKYYKNNYISSTGIYDIYALFVERSVNITKEGIVGFILPNKFILADYGRGMRDLIKDKQCLNKLINFKDNQIFQNASTYTCLLFLKSNSKQFKYSEIENFDKKDMLFIINKYENFDDGNITIGLLNSEAYLDSDWKFYIGNSAKIVQKLMDYPLKLKDISEKIFQGLATSADKIFIVDEISQKGDLVEIYSKIDDSNHLLEKEILKKYIKGKEIKRYDFEYKNKLIIFPYYLYEDSFELIPPKDLRKKYPYAWNYLKKYEKILKEREHGKMNNKDKWYAFTYPKSMIDYKNPKIMTPNSAFSSSFSFDSNGDYYITAGISGGYGLKLKKDCKLNELYLLSILNSSLMTFLNKKIGKSMRGKYYSFEGRVIENYPIMDVGPEEQLPLIELANKMIKLNNQLSVCNTPKEKKLLKLQIKNFDNQINSKVYELYGLTEEEIEIIENSLN